MKRIALILSCAFAAQAATLTFAPPSVSVNPGDVVSLDIVVGSLGGAQVGDFDLDIAFDPALLTPLSTTLGGFLGNLGLAQALDFSGGVTGPGVLNVSEVSLLTSIPLAALQPASFSLATLSFTVGPIAAGSSTSLTITVNALGDSSGASITVDSLGSATLNGPSASGDTPESGSVVLVGIGLTTTMLWRLRRLRGHPAKYHEIDEETDRARQGGGLSFQAESKVIGPRASKHSPLG